MHLNGSNGVNGHGSKYSPSFDALHRIESLRKSGQGVVIDGYSLSIADVVAVARHGVTASISGSSDISERIAASVDFLESKKDASVYGVRTGYGGSASTRTGDTIALQVSLLEHQLCGWTPLTSNYGEMLAATMPIPIVRGAILVRVNSLARGHSGVRMLVLQALVDFLNNGLIPCVPLRGSISASGDLSPLSYVAAAICGHPDVKVFDTKKQEIVYADEALRAYGLEKITLMAKEGLGLVNGTAYSASAGALAIYDAEVLALLTQTTTALTVEAMVGQVGSFDEFLHEVTRPHPGQIKAAQNIRQMLAGSKLAISEEGEVAIQEDIGILRQDRYALRTSAQWIGPQLETLELARKQVEIELNSTTDNPLIDVKGGRFHHGGAFQAKSIAQAMDATRLMIEHLGKLSFAQVTELNNCTMNRGLPSCLAGDEPSTNYHTKGLDIHTAAYVSELGYLANPVSTHVQSAEMHNQSINSLALISARKTLESCEILTLLLSSHLYCALQAIDLRIMDVKFQAQVRVLVEEATARFFKSYVDTSTLALLTKTLLQSLLRRLEETTSWDSQLRFEDAFRHLSGLIVDTLASSSTQSSGDGLKAVAAWRSELSTKACELYRSLRKQATSGQDNTAEAKENLGGTYAVYECVREGAGVKVRRGDVAEGKLGRTIGSSVAAIRETIVDGRLVTAMEKTMA